MESSPTTEIWVERVAAWRASGEKAEAFSRANGYAANTLRWWASKLKREMAVASPSVQLARVVRRPAVTEPRSHTIVLEVDSAGVRVVVEPGADAATLAMVLDIVRGGRP
jgi:hypothetical protein